jgi:anti-anti-sigma regulatory factor
VEVRAHGVVQEVPAAGPADHVCWVYEDDGTFDAAAREFIAAGLARGDRLLCVGDRVIESLRSLSPDHDVAALTACGAVETLTLADVYGAPELLRSEDQLAYYAAATRRAKDDGYLGLRVLAEVSDLVADPARRPDLVRWEHTADAYAASGSGFSAMCAYRADLARDALADVASVHPLVGAPEEVTSFRLFVDGDRIALAGSVDGCSGDRLARVLPAAEALDGGVVLDLTALEFVDVAGCRVLARWAAGLRERSVALEITGSSALLRRMWQLLDLAVVAPVHFAGAPA